jgi:hypothetical protein
MLDFPNAPTVGQIFVAPSGVSWIWDGVKWNNTSSQNAFLPISGGNMTGPIGNGTVTADPTTAMGIADKQYVDATAASFKYGDNRLINGDMMLDQRNGGASGTAIGVYMHDRWAYRSSQANKLTWQRSTVPAGSPLQALGAAYNMGFVSSSAYASVAGDALQVDQRVESDNISDFAWGTSAANPVTLSFLAYASQPGTYSGSVSNGAGTRSYPFTFVITAATTWQKFVIVIPGDPTGAWTLSGAATGLVLVFDMGCGTTFKGPANAWASADYRGASGAFNLVSVNGASLYFANVKLEIGNIATPFQRKLSSQVWYDCQRYYAVMAGLSMIGYNGAGGGIGQTITYPQIMRAAPAPSISSPTYSNASGLTSQSATIRNIVLYATVTASGSAQWACTLTLNAEL